MLNLTPVVRLLILINVLVFAISSLSPFDLNMLFALRNVFSPAFEPYQFVTYMFAHSGFTHIFFNMFGVFMFGPLLEQHWGPKRFLTFYLICGIGAGLLYSGISYYEVHGMKEAAEAYISNPTPVGYSNFIREFAPNSYSQVREGLMYFKENPTNPEIISVTQANVQNMLLGKASVPMVGASGALFGLLMAFGLLFPNIELFLLFLPIPIKAKYFVLFYGAYELYAGMNRMPGDNVAHFAHLGGMLFAFILIKIWQRTDPDHY